MRSQIIIVFLVLAQLAGAQDSYFTSFKSEREELSPAALANQIIADAVSDKQRVRAIFRWIADNIEYKLPSSYVRRKSFYQLPGDDNDTGALKPLNERVSEKVLREGEAFCEGYARLFSTLCYYAGIRSEVVTGYARDGIDRAGKNFRTNHSWNAVYFDSSWHLLDVTWASGYITYAGNRFIRHYDDYYFLTPPASLIRSHYPEDLQWTLLNEQPDFREYKVSPFKMSGYYTRHIKSFSPSSGIIQAKLGDTIHFELEMDDVSAPMSIVDVTAVDSLPLTQVNWWEQPASDAIRNGRSIRAAYVVNDPSVQWLHIIYNHAVALRYRVNIKDDEGKPANALAVR